MTVDTASQVTFIKHKHLLEYADLFNKKTRDEKLTEQPLGVEETIELGQYDENCDDDMNNFD